MLLIELEDRQALAGGRPLATVSEQRQEVRRGRTRSEPDVLANYGVIGAGQTIGVLPQGGHEHG